MTGSPRIEISSRRIAIDREVNIRLVGFEPDSAVTVTAEMIDDLGTKWGSQASFLTDWIGTVDFARDAPTSGTYAGVDREGLLSTIAPVPPREFNAFKLSAAEEGRLLHAAGVPHYDDDRSEQVRFTALVGGKPVHTETLERIRFPDSVTEVQVHAGRVRGSFWRSTENGESPAVVVIGGSGGGAMRSTAALLADRGFAVLDLAYFNHQGLPSELREIPLEYFREGIDWIRHQVGCDRIALMGWSRGGEAVLAIASAYPDFVGAVISVVPGDLYCPLFNDKAGASPSWTLNGMPLPPSVDAWDFKGLPSVTLEEPLSPGFLLRSREVMFDPWYWNSTVYERMAIPVEKIQCPILFVSGGDDQCWNSRRASERAVERLKKARFRHPYRHVSFQGAGHSILQPGTPTSMVDSAVHPVAKVFFTKGGTPQSTAAARRGFWEFSIQFLRDVFCDSCQP